MLKITRRLVLSGLNLVVISSLFLSAPAVRADDISFVNLFGNVSYTQTGNGNTLSPTGAFFSADINSTIPNAYSSASFTTPGGTTTALSALSPTDYHYQSGNFATLAAMESAYGMGTYSFSGVNGSGTDTATLNYTADDYSQTAPYLTGNDYSSLQGMNASQAFTFNLSPYTPGGASDETDALVFLTIYDETTNTTIFSDGFLPSTTTSIVLPGGTLTAGNAYEYELDYSDRDTTTGTGGEFPSEAGFDVRTDGTFSTANLAATPEPDSLVLLGTGLLGIMACVRRRVA